MKEATVVKGPVQVGEILFVNAQTTSLWASMRKDDPVRVGFLSKGCAVVFLGGKGKDRKDTFYEVMTPIGKGWIFSNLLERGEP